MILPIHNIENKKTINVAIGADIAELIPDIMQVLAQYCMKDLEAFDGYLEFIQESIDYMRGETDKLPDVDYSPEKVKELMSIQLGKYRDYKLEEKSETFNPPNDKE